MRIKQAVIGVAILSLSSAVFSAACRSIQVIKYQESFTSGEICPGGVLALTNFPSGVTRINIKNLTSTTTSITARRATENSALYFFNGVSNVKVQQCSGTNCQLNVNNTSQYSNVGSSIQLTNTSGQTAMFGGSFISNTPITCKNPMFWIPLPHYGWQCYPASPYFAACSKHGSGIQIRFVPPPAPPPLICTGTVNAANCASCYK